jgi:ribosomal protein L40E
MSRREFPRPVRAAIILRATDAKGRVLCEQCGAECPTQADYEVDHIVAEGMLTDEAANDNRPPLTATSGKLVCRKCHDKKTRRDVFEIAKTKRLEQKHRIVGKGQTEIARRFNVDQEPDK